MTIKTCNAVLLGCLLAFPSVASAEKPTTLSVGPFTTEVDQQTLMHNLINPDCRTISDETICEGLYPNVPDIKVTAEIYDGIVENVKMSFPSSRCDFIVSEATAANGKPMGGLAGALANKMHAKGWKGNGGKSSITLICEPSSTAMLMIYGPRGTQRLKNCKKTSEYPFLC